MYRILIVDDEPMHRLGMNSMIHRFKPDYLVFTARDGIQALDYIRQFEVDLIITDIRMPNMDGLEFIASAKQAGSRALFAILSGYGEFEYARRAISLGVNRYLLKPANSDDLLDLLNEFEKQMREQETYQQDQIRQMDTYNRLENDSIERTMEKFLLGQLDQRETDSIQALIPGECAGYAICARSTGSGWSSEEVGEWKTSIYQFMKQWGSILSFQCLRLDGVIVSLFATELMEIEMEARLVEFRAAFERGVSEPDRGFVLGMSRSVPHLMDNAEEAFNQAFSACQTAFYHPEETTFVYQEGQALRASLSEAFDLKASDVAQMILGGEAGKAADFLIERFSAFLKSNRPYPGRAREMLLLNFSIIIGGMGDSVDDASVRALLLRAERDIGNASCLEKLNEIIRRLCEACGVAVSSRREAINGEVLEHAMRLLREDCAHDWTIRELAERFHFNPSYFSSMFKQHTGTGYLDFLTNARMERAAQLLRESNMSVTKLAARIGYSNTAYFIKLFRNRYGLTPMEYRKVKMP